jgi:hypothetical protein
MLKLIDDRYNNTVIYKLVCNDPAITDCYVGHTFDFKTRSSLHKSNCNNKKSRKYNYKVYRFIRVNGGFQNFSMVPIAYYNCANFFEAKLKELFHMKELQATLNTQKPSEFVTAKEYRKAYRKDNKDKICNYQKNYHEANRESILAQKNEKHQCICGGCYTMTNRAQHHRSLKHMSFIAMYNTMCSLADRYLETGKITRASLIVL